VVAALALAQGAFIASPAGAATASSHRSPEVKTQPPGPPRAVSCTVPDECTAVGWDAANVSVQTSLAEGWNGSIWTVQPSVNPEGSTSTIFDGVSCLPDGTCVAVGEYLDAAGDDLPLTELWSGGEWSLESTPIPDGATSANLSGVSCVSDAGCTAVGASGTGPVGTYGTNLGFADVWNGAEWTLQSTPAPKGSIANDLNAVSCTSGGCVAVGSSMTSTDTMKTLAETTTGTTWSIKTTLDTKADTYNALYGLSCTSFTSCLAVGYGFAGTSTSAVTSAQVWNGTKWENSKPKKPKGTDSRLVRVSCGPTGTCTAVGGYVTSKSVAESLVEQWTGTKWEVQKTPTPKGSGSYGLLGVSCSAANACAATGDDLINAIATGVPLAEGWNGTKWTVEKTPSSD
jgi:hypothetical protein